LNACSTSDIFFATVFDALRLSVLCFDLIQNNHMVLESVGCASNSSLHGKQQTWRQTWRGFVQLGFDVFYGGLEQVLKGVVCQECGSKSNDAKQASQEQVDVTLSRPEAEAIP